MVRGNPGNSPKTRKEKQKKKTKEGKKGSSDHDAADLSFPSLQDRRKGKTEEPASASFDKDDSTSPEATQGQRIQTLWGGGEGWFLGKGH
jgi:hypothetical protein